MSSKDDQQLAVIRRVDVQTFTGVVPRLPSTMVTRRFLLDQARRGDVEEKAGCPWLQLATYTVVRVQTPEMRRAEFFSYGRKGSEKRLHQRRSIGSGGHAEVSDLANPEYLGCYQEEHQIIDELAAATCREIREELQIPDHLAAFRHLGWVLNSDDSVGRDHLGLVSLLTLPDKNVIACPSEMEDPRWDTLETLYSSRGDYEAWSQLLIQHLVGLESLDQLPI